MRISFFTIATMDCACHRGGAQTFFVFACLRVRHREVRANGVAINPSQLQGRAVADKAALRAASPNVRQTSNVDAQCDKLATVLKLGTHYACSV